MIGSGNHIRINTGVLAAAEKRALIWAALYRAEPLPRATEVRS